MSYIGLLDCNNFFVSCERLFRPDLRTRPTVVLSGNDGCVVARSKEIKDAGIPMGVPYFKAKSELEALNAAVFSSNFTLYRDISSRVMDTLRQEVGSVEQYSVDEAFFSITSDAQDIETELLRIKHSIETRVGVPVSVGAAKTKTIAKYASEVGKKSAGTAFFTGETWEEATEKVPVHAIWGIGRKTSQKMQELGIKTVADFLASDSARIDKLFGVGGLRLHDELSEKPVYTLGSGNRGDVQKSIMSTRSFKASTTEKAVLEDAVAYHIAHVAKELRSRGVKAGWLSVMAGTSRHGDWLLRGGSKDVLLLNPTNDTRLLLKEALQLLSSLFEEGVPYKKAGVVVGNFVDSALTQQSLFSEDADAAGSDADQALMRTLDTLNKRFGQETVTIGRKNKQHEWGSSKRFISPSYTTKWSEIAEISA